MTQNANTGRWEITKTLAVKDLQTEPKENFIPYLFNLVYTENKGAAWGMLADQRWIFITVSTAAVVLIAFALLLWAKEKPLFCISLALILAGGVGNMIDRTGNGFVVDFIQFAFWQSFPVFNVADSYVTIGGFMLLIYYIFIDKSVFSGKKKKDGKEENDDNKAV